jgi:hypothetical protein
VSAGNYPLPADFFLPEEIEMVQAAQDRPPYVTFEIRPVEDRDGTMREGHYVAKDEIFALITPQGSKDRIERVAEDWVKQCFAHAQEGRMPLEWAKAFETALAAYKEGRELPADGTPIVTWPAVGPAQQKSILDANIRTVEDLANANEATLAAIGIGARGLKQKAQAWLDTAGDIGKTALEVENLRQRMSELESRNKTLEDANEQLVAQVAALKQPEDA